MIADRILRVLVFHEPPRLELRYGLGEEHRHMGLATEAATEMIRYGFDTLAFERFEASTDAPNAASVAVMERAGMTFWKRELTPDFSLLCRAPSSFTRLCYRRVSQRERDPEQRRKRSYGFERTVGKIRGLGIWALTRTSFET